MKTALTKAFKEKGIELPGKKPASREKKEVPASGHPSKGSILDSLRRKARSLDGRKSRGQKGRKKLKRTASTAIYTEPSLAVYRGNQASRRTAGAAGSPTNGAPERAEIRLGASARINPALYDTTGVLRYVEPAISRGRGYGGEELDLVVGFDFGTAFTKVVVQDNERRVSWAIPFAEDSEDRYFLPTRVYASGSKSVEYNLSGGETCHADLKAPLVLKKRLPDDHGAIVAAFMALVLRHTIDWVLNVHEGIGGRSVQWHVRLGIPARNLDEPDLLAAFWTAGFAAMILAFDRQEVIDHRRAHRALRQASGVLDHRGMAGEQEKPIEVNGVDLYPSQLELVPEVAAQINGYVRSELWDRSEPKFMIVDIGGGTLDAAIFNVTESVVGRGFHFLGSIVEPLGAVVLHRRRLDWLRKLLDQSDDGAILLEAIDELAARSTTQESVLDGVFEYILDAEISGRTVDDEFFAEYAGKLWTDLIHEVRSRYDPRSNQWSKLPLLMCGGARSLKIYRQYIATLNRDKNRNVNLREFQNGVPEGLDAPGLVDLEFHRLSVAYGLSFFEIGQYVGTGEIETMPSAERARPWQSRFISKDDV